MKAEISEIFENVLKTYNFHYEGNKKGIINRI